MTEPCMTKSMLSADERGRYARHLTLPELGVAGQLRLKAASVLCVGAGGLGSPLLLYLAAAGIGGSPSSMEMCGGLQPPAGR